MNVCSQDVEIKLEGTRHMLILFNCKMDMAGTVDFAAANAKSSAQLRVKGDRNNTDVHHTVKAFVGSQLKMPGTSYKFLFGSE